MDPLHAQSARRDVPPLTPHGAEQLVAELRSRYGLGQAYQLEVRSDGHGRWEIADGLGKHRVVSPMNEPRFRQWFWDHYGDVIVERQHTSEG